MGLFISQAHAQTAGAQPQGGVAMQMIFLLGLFVFFYFIAIRPQRKRQKEHDLLVGGLQKGDEVVMTSGLLGKVRKIEGDYLVLEAADGMELKFQRIAVHAVLPKGTLKAV
ncbi:MAG: preprotein translocase subunit YajC [Cellvibrionales bacterium]|jgi:preprotein translocase subunit YajC|nr:preprotein translocase subunit YajC [Cellvibrionales bacterium]MBT5922984.1 preprotein translocase subunit YajC [Cellvibrionales bacterium]MDB4456208.1 preprotein translocase subunit YajC [bacterium]